METGTTGRLIYLMGPSGSGKDTLLKLAMPQIKSHKILLARRCITRPQTSGNEAEQHIPMTEEAFLRMRDAGGFALHWQSHGYQYGIEASIDSEMQQGRTVVVNGSRAYLPVALARYPDLLPVLICVPPEVLKERLLARGREHGSDLEERLLGAHMAVCEPCVSIDNSGPPKEALERLLSLLRGYAA